MLYAPTLARPVPMARGNRAGNPVDLSITAMKSLQYRVNLVTHALDGT
jgi:hypothetical protein